jgi:hypothetical protein
MKHQSPVAASRPPLDLDTRQGEVDFRDLAELFPPAVTITRTSEADFKSRQLVVSIDGERVATLLWGDSITRELEPGPHRIHVHNTLVWKSVDFTLGPHEQVYFEVINRTGPGTLVMTVLFGIGPLYVTVRRM